MTFHTVGATIGRPRAFAERPYRICGYSFVYAKAFYIIIFYIIIEIDIAKTEAL